MSNISKRILSGFLTLILLSIVLLIPVADFFLLVLALLIIAAIGSVELYRLTATKGFGSTLSLIAPVLIITQYIECKFFRHYPITLYGTVLLISLIFIIEIFRGNSDKFQGTLSRNAFSTFTVIYPSLFLSFIVRIAFFPSPFYFLLLFFMITLLSDTFAYIAGMLFGGGTRGFLKVSPNKSIVGFAAGIIIPSLISALYVHIIGDRIAISTLESFFVSLPVALFAELGDLVESSLKRSASVKDSGNKILGRGGILDAVDSVIFAAPLFVMIISIIL